MTKVVVKKLKKKKHKKWLSMKKDEISEAFHSRLKSKGGRGEDSASLHGSFDKFCSPGKNVITVV